MKKQKNKNGSKRHLNYLMIFMIILISFLLLCIPISYLVCYQTHTDHASFGESKQIKLKISEKVEDFDLDFQFKSYVEASYSTEDEKDEHDHKHVEAGKIRVGITVSNFKTNVSNLKIKYDLGSDWATVSATSADHKINNGKKILSASDPKYTSTHIITCNTVFPLKSVPLVSVKNPTIYVRVSYEVDSKIPGQTTENRTVYLKIKPKTYLQSIKDYEASTTTTTSKPTTTKPTTTTTITTTTNKED